MTRIMSEGTHNSIVDALLRTRRDSEHAAGETTLLCYAAMDLCSGNKLQRISAGRVIDSVLRRNKISQYKRTVFKNRIKKADRAQVADYLLNLQPYKETKVWLRSEV